MNNLFITVKKNCFENLQKNLVFWHKKFVDEDGIVGVFASDIPEEELEIFLLLFDKKNLQNSTLKKENGEIKIGFIWKGMFSWQQKEWREEFMRFTS